VSVTASSPLPVMASSAKRYSLAIGCSAEGFSCTTLFQIPAGKVFVIESVMGQMNAYPSDGSWNRLAINTTADQMVGNEIAGCLFFPTRSGVGGSFFSSSTLCHVQGDGLFGAEGAGATWTTASITFSGYLIDK
ncbi:MAG: hypothetical protein H6Q86_4398, partial [candidate division NC10 bacterium]|nr:hypothetical protein [candidate division NC10 bacterium]